MRWAARSGSASPGRVGGSNLCSIELRPVSVPALPDRRDRTVSILCADFREDRLHRFNSMRLRGWSMGYSLEQFSAACHRILSDDPGAEGRKKVCALVEDVLKDEAFVAAHLVTTYPSARSSMRTRNSASAFLGMSTTAPERASRTITVPSWAIYGQAR